MTALREIRFRFEMWLYARHLEGSFYKTSDDLRREARIWRRAGRLRLAALCDEAAEEVQPT